MSEIEGEGQNKRTENNKQPKEQTSKTQNSK